MIELPSKRPKTRPFNLEHAKAGAVVITSLGFRARIICWDMNDDGLRDLIVVLVKRYKGSDQEEIIIVDRDGKGQGRMSSLGDLCMAPVATVEGKAAFTGDVVYDLEGQPTTVHFATWPPFKETDMPQYKLNPPPIEFEGKPLQIMDKIWYREVPEAEWTLVDCKDSWSEINAINESHFGYIKRNAGRKMALVCYTRKSPHNLVLEGEEVKLGDRLWYNKEDSRHLNFVVDKGWMERFEVGMAKVEHVTRKPATKVENWQARVTTGKSKSSAFWGDTYPSEQDCKNLAPSTIPLGYEFVKAEKVSEYWQ